MQTNKVDVRFVSKVEWTLIMFPNQVVHTINTGIVKVMVDEEMHESSYRVFPCCLMLGVPHKR